MIAPAVIRTAKIHILGGSGSGTTTLGRAVAEAIGVPHFDTDDYFWLPSDPPFVAQRPAQDRVKLLLRDLPAQGGWVLSGSALGWAKPLEILYDLIVYLRVDPTIRMQRLKLRERERHGARIAQGGDMERTHAAFLKWAAAYDTAGAEQRSHVGHQAWLATQSAKIIRLDATSAIDALAADVVAALTPTATPAGRPPSS